LFDPYTWTSPVKLQKCFLTAAKTTPHFEPQSKKEKHALITESSKGALPQSPKPYSKTPDSSQVNSEAETDNYVLLITYEEIHHNLRI
jgi:hypothetical protein